MIVLKMLCVDTVVDFFTMEYIKIFILDVL